MALCPNRHENSDTLAVCRVCGLPLIAVEREFARLTEVLARRAVLARPKPRIIVAGIGSKGSAIVSSLRRHIGHSIPGAAFIALDMSRIVLDKDTGVEPLLSLQLDDTTMGSSVFCGRCEKIAEDDPSLGYFVRNVGLRETDGNQAVIAALSIGEGPAAGIAPIFLSRVYASNPESSVFGTVVLPAANDSLHAHINAYYGLARLLGSQESRSLDCAVVLQHDRLSKVRGVGPVGEELKMEAIVEGLMGLMAVTLRPPAASKFASLDRWMHTPVLVPCLALGRSLEIFGSLNNILESSLAYPLCPISRDDVVVAEYLLKIPRRLAGSFPEAVLAQELAYFNQRHFRNVNSTLFQAAYVDQSHDRIDACILLGGISLSDVLGETKGAFERFRNNATDPQQWQVYGLDEARIAAAERTVAVFG